MHELYLENRLYLPSISTAYSYTSITVSSPDPMYQLQSQGFTPQSQQTPQSQTCHLSVSGNTKCTVAVIFIWMHFGQLQFKWWVLPGNCSRKYALYKDQETIVNDPTHNTKFQFAYKHVSSLFLFIVC